VRIENGSPLPSLLAHDLDGEDVDLAVMGTGKWAVVLFYRGHW
jgi:peroxiredoxin